jgi:hypothetical protein
MEESLSILLVHFLHMENDTAITLIHKLAICERSELLRKLVAADKSEHVGIIAMLLFACKCYDICNDNRNTLIHALYESTDAATSVMRLTKRQKNPIKELTLGCRDDLTI